MKPTFSPQLNKQQSLTCERQSLSSRYSSFLAWALGASSWVAGKAKSLSQRCAPAERVLLAIRVQTKPLASSITINNRIYGGLILVIIVAPLSACIHMLPGMKDLVSKEWFYECWYNLFLVLGPYFFSICVVLTSFLWLPPISKRIKFSKKSISFQLTRAFSIPLGYCIGKIVWLIFCDTNADFERLGNPLFFVGGAVIGYVALRVLEYLVWRQEHVMNALIDSLQGLYKIDIDPIEREKMAAPYWNELRQFHSKY